MTIEEYLRISAQEINDALETFFLSWKNELSPHISPLIDSFHEATKGGKRLRGALVKLGYLLAGGTDEKAILSPAIASEIFQTAILAHDDIIDRSLLRRGKPSLYKALGGDHLGISRTICLGDLGFFLAFTLLSESNFPEQEKNAGLHHFSQSLLETTKGQLLDVELPQVKKIIQEEDIISVYRLKTAQYTVVSPLVLGATLGGATKDVIAKLHIYGENVGIAYQIQDDIDDIFASAEVIKKETGLDVKEGKQTLLFIHALQYANDKQKKILRDYYGNEKSGQEELEKIRRIFIDTGALEYAKNRALEYIEEAKRQVSEITDDTQIQELLFGVAEYFIPKQ